MNNYYNWIGINEEEIEAYEAEKESDFCVPEDFDSYEDYLKWWNWYCNKYPSIN